MHIERIPFGKTKTGEAVDRFTVRNSGGMSFSLITYGATITSVVAPDRDGTLEELTLGFDSLAAYEGPHPYFGATVGRYANRIGGAVFRIGQKTYELDMNHGRHHLHGGAGGFSRRIWDGYPLKRENEAGVALALHSPDGDQGYPGNLDVKLTVMLSEKNELSFTYEASADAPTPVNLTNHSYWNLAGACSGKVYDHRLTLNSEAYLEVDEELIPTGELMPVDETPFDFRREKRIGRDLEEAGGYDHCFTLSAEHALSIPAAVVREPGSGRKMEVFTITPGVQFYTGNFLNGVETRCGKVQPHSAFCLETQEYPDAMNRENFPDPILQPNDRYFRKTVYHFTAE
jgi:aldose 1-epimerase